MRHLAALHAALRAGAPAQEVLEAVCDRARRALPAAAVLILDASGRPLTGPLTGPSTGLPTGTHGGRPGLDAIVAAVVRTGRPLRRGALCCVPLPVPAGPRPPG
ncbi:hypothetical protein OHA72_20935 [Dactylosporangium sp. NBC_01737]|uniref:hypothetical protein n=1 Tax=Dactylosporangium sp. NBC_01737 TaxID=2975959 RepID=UPI002E1127F8|nr:hypothetical protein OHA72_20935 [Dactylosporangium sp. NBC_01737]